ncbi:Imidazolonepropionase [Saccharopolyspora antimicrobica]|uniref:Imidazolonepropionase n=1 Tax=Saccharopolyspora antimicrobica TaxID=455193 RepID=A0A1I5AX81_9PSEU|nr:amidohydrolase family protein [Saccharopolyspora antimicrobica]RKT86394.1 imidazolonepropionase-like amidohydrolase [Saccharopolyspora antimicrobica]SFN66981.1 Imidazolonepropionase [Saccharopolyspora antimicrobica]
MKQLITAAQVLLGPEGRQIADGAILLDEDTILAVGPRREVEAHAGTEIHRSDFPNHTLLPGLINCHAHLALDAGPDPLASYLDTDDNDLLLGMAGRAQQAVRSGVTTLRDLGDRRGLAFHVRDAIARGDLGGPRILAAGSPLTIPRGHCHFFGGEVSGEREIRQHVQDMAARGADVIKVMASGGHITPDSPPMWATQFSADELRITVEEAASAGLPVAAHAHGSDAIAAAVEAGVSTIEHCTWLQPGGGGYDQRDDVAKSMANQGIYACIAWPPDWRGFMERLGPERAEKIIERFLWMDELGVRLIPGTDAGLRDARFDGYADALELYAHIGFSNGQIIEMATVTSAEALGRADSIGRLEPGYFADLVVVAGDPLLNLNCLSQVQLVIANGEHMFSSGSTSPKHFDM